MLVRLVQPEMIGLFHVHERRHVEALATVVSNARVVGADRCHISVAFAERVVNLIDDRGELPG